MDYFIAAIFILWVFWHGYIHAMGLYRAKLQGRLKGLPLILCIPVVVITFLLDVFLQLTVASLVFWQWPIGLGFEWRKVRGITVPWPVGDWFVTHRLRRYIAMGPSSGWRYRLAHSICYYLTDPFDPTGEHCDSESPVLQKQEQINKSFTTK
jgi:hypothetical protein